ncbi:hypothetical protein QVD17_06934 [Tagetes erecta]|uniref:Uncharacterized protein n=1 Tax=Tagetes erecta TaxID=13708 RepID=A0AAD8LL70_TARER|nr:hypothetical protein QVD17_06934 [Tagetes erecta]
MFKGCSKMLAIYLTAFAFAPYLSFAFAPYLRLFCVPIFHPSIDVLCYVDIATVNITATVHITTVHITAAHNRCIVLFGILRRVLQSKVVGCDDGHIHNSDSSSSEEEDDDDDDDDESQSSSVISQEAMDEAYARSL